MRSLGLGAVAMSGSFRGRGFLPTFALHGEGSVPPYPASHGCVRITIPAMQRLYGSLYIGMTIYIYG